MDKLTVIAPVFNEQEVVADFYLCLSEVLRNLKDLEVQILFVVDKSQDATLTILEEVAKRDPIVSILSLSSRFGHQMCLIAGIEKAQDSEILVMMDSDLQHPPSLIPTLLNHYRNGSDVVFTVRNSNNSVGRTRRLLGKIFYYFIGRISTFQLMQMQPTSG